MRTRHGIRTLPVAGLLAVLGLTSGTRAQGGEIPLNRVPGAVMNSAKARFPGAEIKVASEETEDGKPPVYELKLKHHRRDVGVTLQADGTVVQMETAVPAKELPKTVLRVLERRYPGASFNGAGSVKKGPEVKKKADYYEFYLMTADQRPVLVQVAPDGKVLKPVVKTAVKKRDKKAS
jgi:hypothetical protein